MSNRTKIVNALAAIAFIAMVLGYINRASIREMVYEWQQPDVPEAVSFEDISEKHSPENIAVTADDAGKAAEEENKTMEKEAEESAPAILPADLPAEIQLDVPFLLQAPKQNWVQPFADACEEASLLMVHAYYTAKGSDFGDDEGIEAILKVAAFEDDAYGHNKDTNTEEVGQTAEKYFGYDQVVIRDVNTPNDIKELLAKGYPVIVPAYGKALGNPNFRNGGPDYHMLVIKGYTADGYWITNDPGTRRGKGYVYQEDILMNAIHEFYPGDMTKGRKRMIVLIP